MATIWLKEIHQKYINKKINKFSEVKISRWATFIVGLIAITLALALNTSGKWLAQSAAEIGAIFTLLNLIILPAFIYAIFSPRASTALIWLLAAYSIGDSVVNKVWYALSRSTKQAWEPGDPLSWAGPISIWYLLIPLAAGFTAIAVWMIVRRYRNRIANWAFLLFAALCFGASQSMLVWVVCSNLLIETSPMAKSFAFNLPLTLIAGFIALRFSPMQNKEKYQGLTLGTINEPILADRKN